MGTLGPAPSVGVKDGGATEEGREPALIWGPAVFRPGQIRDSHAQDIVCKTEGFMSSQMSGGNEMFSFKKEISTKRAINKL